MADGSEGDHETEADDTDDSHTCTVKLRDVTVEETSCLPRWDHCSTEMTVTNNFKSFDPRSIVCDVCRRGSVDAHPKLLLSICG